MVCRGRPYHFKIFTGCFPKILIGPFLNAYLIYYCTQIRYKKIMQTIQNQNPIHLRSSSSTNHLQDLWLTILDILTHNVVHSPFHND